MLRQAEERLGEYWLANYEPAAGSGEGGAAAQGGDGTVAGPWDGAVDAVVELMQDLLVRREMLHAAACCGLLQPHACCGVAGCWPSELGGFHVRASVIVAMA